VYQHNVGVNQKLELREEENGIVSVYLISPSTEEMSGSVPPGASGEGKATSDWKYRPNQANPLRVMNAKNRHFYRRG